MPSVEVMQVIKTELERRGSGKDGNSPIRIIAQYWTMNGELLFEVDPCARVVPIEEDATPNSRSTKDGE